LPDRFEESTKYKTATHQQTTKVVISDVSTFLKSSNIFGKEEKKVAKKS